jgi:hypothetical protein
VVVVGLKDEVTVGRERKFRAAGLILLSHGRHAGSLIAEFAQACFESHRTRVLDLITIGPHRAVGQDIPKADALPLGVQRIVSVDRSSPYRHAVLDHTMSGQRPLRGVLEVYDELHVGLGKSAPR